MNELKRHLYDIYGGFTDKRIKNLDNGSRFTVDDRGRGDYDARKELFYWFCKIFVEVINNDSIEVLLQCQTDITLTAGIPDKISITRETVDELENAAIKIGNIIKKKYKVPSYKYVCPRTAASLRKLKDNLKLFWNNN